MDKAKLLAVRRVTQDNKERRTAKVDGIKKLNGKQRVAVANKLKLDGKAFPIKRIWIPKPRKSEKYPHGGIFPITSFQNLIIYEI